MLVQLNTWPATQACVGCKFSSLVDDKKVGSSAYVCHKAIDAEDCPMQEVFVGSLSEKQAYKIIETKLSLRSVY